MLVLAMLAVMPGAVTERELGLLPTEGGSQAPRNFPWKGTPGSG